MADRASINPLPWVTGANAREHERLLTSPTHDKVAGTWKRMRNWAIRQLGSESQAEDALQEAAFSVARAGHASTILRPDAYVAKTVLRKVDEVIAQNEPVDYVGSADDVETVMGIPEKDWVKELEDHVFMEEFLAAMDDESRAICHKWLRGDEWKEIADDLGCSVQHAKDKLRRAIESTKKRLLGPGRPNR